MVRKEVIVEKATKLMWQPDYIRNIGVVAHVDHGKTTTSDNLVAGSGMISEELAGKQLVLDYLSVEQERQMTVNAANISIIYELDGKDHLINLIDTPGHVDFGGDVTRAMRAVDGAIVVVCGVEGVQTQTERVLMQALKERVKPVLFINKIDRLIKELQLTPEEMQQRFVKIITRVNEMIQKYGPEEQRNDWLISPEKGNVAFGSAFNNWAISTAVFKRANINFKNVYDLIKDDKQKELAKMVPLYKTLLEIVIKFLPNPVTAQKYRIPTIWKGDLNSDIGKAMVASDKTAPLVMMVTDITMDPHAGAVATGRVFAGSAKKGQKVFLITGVTEASIQQVSLYMGADRVLVDEVPAGNIVALVGVKDIYTGETVCEQKVDAFEEMKHYSEPVVTKSLEPKDARELHKLVEALKALAREDPTLRVEINEETGECLVSGMGELHLEIVEWKLKNQRNIEVVTSKPIVVYRETVIQKSTDIEGKSPNRHNRFYIVVEPLEEGVYKAMIGGEVKEGKPKDVKALAVKMKEWGMDYDEAKKIWDIKNNNVLIDMTKGIQYLNEAKELIMQAFEDAVESGPLAQEKVTKMKVKLTDAVLHEDAVHRGPAQVIPAVKRPIYAGMLGVGTALLEPKQKLFISVPQEFMGAVTNSVQGRRGQILEINQEGDLVTVVGKVPISEMFGFSDDIRSKTEGRALWSTEYVGYEKLPEELQAEIVKKTRERKGLPVQPPTAESFLE